MDVKICHDAFSNTWCEQTRKMVLGNIEPQKVIQGQEFIEPHELIVKRYRECELRWLRARDPRDWVQKIRQEIFEFLKTINNENFFLNDLNDLEPLQYTIYYGQERGGYWWHRDINHHDYLHDKPNLRRLSISLQISDKNEFQGGGLEFREGKLGVEPGPPDSKSLVVGREDVDVGTAVVFKSSLMHKALPVISGERHVLVGWIRDKKLE